MKLRVISLLICISGGMVMAIEEPQYEVLQRYETFEIRQYDFTLVAEVIVTDDFKSAGNKAFRKLFNYISGENMKQENIDMTVPVKQKPATPAGEKIQMTAPVIQEKDESTRGSYIVGFVMPSKYTLDTLPVPKDKSVIIRQIEPRTVAVIKYSGTWSKKRYDKHEKMLIEEIKAKGLTMVGKPVFARYNPPITPWFMRRNEIIIPVVSPQ